MDQAAGRPPNITVPEPELPPLLTEFSNNAYVWWVRMHDGEFAFVLVDPDPPEANS